MKEGVILIDPDDRMIGTMDKMAVHRLGRLHRAVSVFIFNTGGELLLQQRDAGKYHSGGLWSNTCCSHPRPGETSADAAVRRLFEEMGMCCELDNVFNFTYRAEVGNGLVEFELDHVFFGVSDDIPFPQPGEAVDFCYMSLQKLKMELMVNPENYTSWLNICFDQAADTCQKLLNYEPLAE